MKIYATGSKIETVIDHKTLKTSERIENLPILLSNALHINYGAL